MLLTDTRSAWSEVGESAFSPVAIWYNSGGQSMASRIMQAGNRYTIYHNPVYCVEVEGTATVIEILGRARERPNLFGEVLYRCLVQFDDGRIEERVVPDSPGVQW
jgi:hypothetical protein